MDIQYIDTCLSCYVLDHCSGDVKSELHAEVRASDCDKPGFDYDAAHAAIDAAFKGTHPLKTWDSSLERADPDGESCYSWFRLSWEAEA